MGPSAWGLAQLAVTTLALVSWEEAHAILEEPAVRKGESDKSKADLKGFSLLCSGCTVVVDTAAQLEACATISLTKVGLTLPKICFDAVLLPLLQLSAPKQFFSFDSYIPKLPSFPVLFI